MPKFTPEKQDNGSYVSANLNDKQFNQLFRKIEQAQKKARRDAKRTLKPSTLNNPTSKALKALGEKAKGVGFTKEDLQKFDKARKQHAQKYDRKTAGITYGFLIKNCRQIDIDRANNRVDDGTGISRAALIGTKGDIVLIRVKASIGSKHQEHKVKVRLEQWDDFVNDPVDGDYNKSVELACGGRVSFDCDCGRHQYWYRYLATMGNYCLAPPKEFSFPKIRNPEMKGVACKHVIKTMTMLQSPAWQRILAKRMEEQAKRTGFGSDNRTQLLSSQEKKEAAKNRKTTTNRSAAEREYKRYLKATKAFDKKFKDSAKKNNEVKRLARKARKAEQAKQQFADMFKMGFQNFYDGYKVSGKTKGEAITDFAKMMNISESKLKGLVK